MESKNDKVWSHLYDASQFLESIIEDRLNEFSNAVNGNENELLELAKIVKHRNQINQIRLSYAKFNGATK
jgi:hypothetical protein